MRLNCSEIVTNLYLADLHAVTHDQVTNFVTMFVSVCKDDIDKYDIFLKNLKGLFVVIKSMRKECDEALNTIRKHINGGEGVVVFCETCKMRSCSLAAAYLIKYAGLSAADAIECIKSKCESAFPDECVYASLLLQLEKEYAR